MLRHLANYAPAHAVYALAALVNLALFTRFLSPHDYGLLALVIATTATLQSFTAQWLMGAIMRFYQKHQKANTEDELVATCGALFLGLSGLSLLGAGLWAALGQGDFAHLVVPMAVVYAVPLTLQQLVMRVHMATLQSQRYGVLMMAQTALSSVLASSMAIWFWPTPVGVLMGLAGGVLPIMLADKKLTVAFLKMSKASLPVAREVVGFAWSTILSSGLAQLARRVNTFIVFGLLGAASSGALSAVQSLTEQALAMVFMLVAMAAQPLSVKAQETESPEAVQNQLKQNILWMVGLGLPAMAGFIALAPELTALFVGEALRPQVLSILGLMTIAAFLNGLRGHYIAHSFFLAHKLHFALYLGVATLALSLALNTALISPYGLMGAAWATVGVEALMLMVAYGASFWALPLPFPAKPLALIALASATMYSALMLITLANPILALLTKIAVGGLVYGAAIAALNPAGVREAALPHIKKGLAKCRFK